MFRFSSVSRRYFHSFCRFLLVAMLLVGLLVRAPVSTVQAASGTVNILPPSGSGTFGQVTVLPNGNLVVVDSGFDGVGIDSGAVYLYGGIRLSKISTLVGGTAGDQVGDGGC